MSPNSRSRGFPTFFLVACFVAATAGAASAACLRITKVNVPNNQVSVTNVDVGTQPGGYWLCNFPSYTQVGQSVASGQTLVLSLPAGFLTAGDGEVGLYSTNSFGSSSAIMDYMEYGNSGHTRSSVAITAGVWTASDFVPLPGNGRMQWTGSVCSDPGNSTVWGAVVAAESQSFAAVKALFR